MTMLEDALRERFEALTPEPPADSGPRADYPGRRRPSWLLPLAAAAAVLLVVALAVVISRSYQPRSPASPNMPARPPAPAVPVAPPGMRLVGYHGITVAVPASYQVGPLRCGAPQSNAVVTQTGIGYLCPTFGEPAKNLTIVTLSPFTLDTGQATGGKTTVDGVPAIRTRGQSFYGVAEVLGLESLDVMVAVSGPDPAEASRILATVRVVPIDEHGCVDTPAPLDANSNFPAASVLPTDGVTSVISCVYTPDRRLIGSGPLTRTQVAALAYDLGLSVPGSTGPPLVVLRVRYLIRYADGTTRVVEASVSSGYIHATDGRLHLTVREPAGRDLPYSYD